MAPFSMKTVTKLLSGLADRFGRLLRDLRPYHPEQHYMRGGRDEGDTAGARGSRA